MPHSNVIQAHAVLADQTNYPEVIVAHAHVIVNWSNKKRVAVQWLWTHRSLLNFWLRSQVGSSQVEKNRAATRALSATVSRDVLNNFHQAYNYLGKTRASMGMTMMLFDSLMQMLVFPDLAMMYKYFSCSNAARIDLGLAPVAFLRWVNGTTGIEVLAWRLLIVSFDTRPAAPQSDAHVE